MKVITLSIPEEDIKILKQLAIRDSVKKGETVIYTDLIREAIDEFINKE